jgi:hypothetical protein
MTSFPTHFPSHQDFLDIAREGLQQHKDSVMVQKHKLHLAEIDAQARELGPCKVPYAKAKATIERHLCAEVNARRYELSMGVAT